MGEDHGYDAAEVDATRGELNSSVISRIDARVRSAQLPPRNVMTFTHIATNSAVFSLLGTTFGGDGITTFALPDLRSFAPQGLQYSICILGIFPSSN